MTNAELWSPLLPKGMSKSGAMWTGWQLKGRDHYAMYSRYRLSDLPEVIPFRQLENIKTPSGIPMNIQQIIEAVTPTNCYFDLESDENKKELNGNEPREFFHDQQECVNWRFDPNTGHIVEDCDEIVAFSLAEFLSRILIESFCWMPHSATLPGHTFEQLMLDTEEESLIADVAEAAKAYHEHLQTHPCQACPGSADGNPL